MLATLDKETTDRYIALLKRGILTPAPQFGPFWCWSKHYYVNGRFRVERFSEGEAEEPFELTEEEFRNYLLSYTGHLAEAVAKIVKEKPSPG